MKQVKHDFDTLVNGVSTCQKALDSFPKDCTDAFSIYLTDFLKTSRECITSISMSIKMMEARMLQVAEAFGEQVQQLRENPNILLEPIAQFLHDWKHCKAKRVRITHSRQPSIDSQMSKPLDLAKTSPFQFVAQEPAFSGLFPQGSFAIFLAGSNQVVEAKNLVSGAPLVLEEASGHVSQVWIFDNEENTEFGTIRLCNSALVMDISSSMEEVVAVNAFTEDGIILGKHDKSRVQQKFKWNGSCISTSDAKCFDASGLKLGKNQRIYAKPIELCKASQQWELKKVNK